MISTEQAQSVQRLQDNVTQVIHEKFPFTSNGYTFDVSNVHFETPNDTHEAQLTALDTNATMDTLVRATVTVTKDGKAVFSPFKNMVLVRIPHINDRGTYIVKGNETVLLNRMNLRPGVYIHDIKSKEKSQLIQTEVRSGNQRFVIVFDTLKPSLNVENLTMDFNKKTGGKVDALNLLRILGASEDEIHTAIGDDSLYQQLAAASPNKNAIQRVHAALSAIPFPGVDAAKASINDFFHHKLTFNASGQGVNEVTLGEAHATFEKQAFLDAVSQMMKEYRAPGSSPDIDDFRFKDILSGEDALSMGFGKGIDAWINRVLRPFSLNPGQRASVRPQDYIKMGIEGILKNENGYAELADVANPLALLQAKQKVTVLGRGGLSPRSAEASNRDLQDTAFAKLDPIETPQSNKLGLIQHLTKDAVIKNGRIYGSFYRVKKGKVDTSELVNDLDPLREYDQYVAFNDPRQLENVGGALQLKGREIHARHKGDFITTSPEKITYIDKSPSSVLGYSASLIPFGAHNDGARMLMGANMQSQAMSMKDLEAPIVQSLTDANGQTVEEDVANKASFMLRSPVAGKIKAIHEDSIEIEQDNGEIKSVPKLNYFTAGKMGGYINHRPVVSVGDSVQENSLLADGWQSKNGQLALGKNALVAFMPYEGYNFEDGIAVSHSYANRMVSEEVKPLEFEFDASYIVGKPEVKKRLASLDVSSKELATLDADGVIRKGEDIEPGSILVGAVREKIMTGKESMIHRLLYSPGITTPADEYSDKSERAAGYQTGKVIDVRKIKEGDGYRVTLKILSFKPMQVGDKLAGRHGNKGTITQIFDDEEMPQTPDGKAIEVMFSPLAIPSRKNLGQLLEVNAGLVAQKKGMDVYKVHNFDPAEREKVMQGLQEIGVPDGKMKLFNPITGKHFENEITVGPMYIMKLKHKVENKITSRNIGDRNSKIDEVTLSPRKVSGSIDGERSNPQGVGGMEFWSLTSAGAVHNIHEMTTLKSDGAGDKEGRKDIFNAIRNGLPIKDPMTPQTLRVLQDKLHGAGVSMTPLKDGKDASFDEEFNSLMLQPATKEDLDKLNPRTVTTAKGVEIYKGIRAKGGLYDPEIFGENGDQWGKIELSEPLPNPLFMQPQGAKPYEAMLYHKNLQNKHIKSILEDGKFVVLDPKNTHFKKYQVIDVDDVIAMEKTHGDAVVDTGPSALVTLLKDVDLKTAYEDAEARLKNAHNVKDRSLAENHVRILANALEKGLKPDDYLMHYIPVLPEKYRPLIQRDNHYTEDGITHLYQKLMITDRGYSKMLDHLQETFSHPNFAHLPSHDPKDLVLPEMYAESQKEKYKTLKHVVGIGEPFMDRSKHKEYFGIMHGIAAKEGFLRENMQKKMQDFSGRSVITVDPTLDLDQVGLPEDLAATMFEAHVMRKLKQQGYNDKQIHIFLKRRTPEFQHALETVAETEKYPVILNRQPSLHRHSMQAFFPVIRWNEDKRSNLSIGLNPVVTTGFGADFDGDTMPVFLPLTRAAKDEAIDKLMPSKNLLNPTNNSLIMDLKHEMQLGIYYMTGSQQNPGTPKKFRGLDDVTTAYERGEVRTYDPAEVNGRVSTVGKHLFELSLPKEYRDYDAHTDMDNDKIDTLIQKIIHDNKLGPAAAVDVINKLRRISFKVSTLSGMSIGIKDFQPILDKKKEAESDLIAEADAKLKSTRPDLYMSALQDERLAAEQFKSNYVKERMEDLIKNSDLLHPDNPVKIMMASGARGNAGQINAMAGVIGVGKSVTNQPTRPVNVSHIEGLSPNQFWDLSADSRKGIFDKSIATQEPGALTRQIWMANKQTIISEHDCGDRIGVVLNLANASDRQALRGRVLLENIHIEGGRDIRANGRPLEQQDYEQIKNKSIHQSVRVRSPLTCKSTLGICQLCYGARAGSMDNRLVPIGEAVGSIAAQALGEPSQQAIMKTFHTGAGNSKVNGAFERIKQLLTFGSINEAQKAVLVHDDGRISAVHTDPATQTSSVFVGDRKYALGQKPIAEGIREGAEVRIGDSLTKEKEFLPGPGNKFTYHTFRDPREVLQLQGVAGAHDYMLRSLNDALTLGDIKNTDRRHLEVVIGNMTGQVKIVDGGTTPFLPTRTVDRKAVEFYNNENDKNNRVRVDINYATRYNVIGSKAATDYRDSGSQIIVHKGEVITADMWDKLNRQHRSILVEPRNATFEPIIAGVKARDPKSDPEWLDSAAKTHANQSIGYGAAFGAVDKLSNPLTRQMTGLMGNFGDAFHSWKDKVQDKLHFHFF